MNPEPATVVDVRLNTNDEMIERERLAVFLAAIEDEVRAADFGGPDAVLLVGAVRRGSVEIAIGFAQLAVGTASLAVTTLAFLWHLKERSADKRRNANPFAAAISDLMLSDGVSRVDFRHGDDLVSIERSEVPFVQRLRRGSRGPETPLRIRPERLTEEAPRPDGMVGVEDEDQDWVPTLEAADAPPVEALEPPSGSIASIRLAGQFVSDFNGSEPVELRFSPRDQTLADFFVVTGNELDFLPEEDVDMTVTADIDFEDRKGTMRLIDIDHDDDSFVPLRQG